MSDFGWVLRSFAPVGVVGSQPGPRRSRDRAVDRERFDRFDRRGERATRRGRRGVASAKRRTRRAAGRVGDPRERAYHLAAHLEVEVVERGLQEVRVVRVVARQGREGGPGGRTPAGRGALREALGGGAEHRARVV